VQVVAHPLVQLPAQLDISLVPVGQNSGVQSTNSAVVRVTLAVEVLVGGKVGGKGGELVGLGVQVGVSVGVLVGRGILVRLTVGIPTLSSYLLLKEMRPTPNRIIKMAL
jgi:hypothetical protein